jgi:hypothetical protein
MTVPIILLATVDQETKEGYKMTTQTSSKRKYTKSCVSEVAQTKMNPRKATIIVFDASSMLNAQV